jgi:hypothetical protein
MLGRQGGASRVSGVRALAATTAVGFVLALSGCGSSSSSHSSSSAAAPASAPASETTASSPSTAAPQSGGTTAAGTKLAPGATALVNFEPESTPFRLELGVLSIQKAGPGDMNGVELSKAQQEQTPYYVRLQVRNVGSGNVAAHDVDPADEFQATDDRGGQAQELTLLGHFRPCESVEEPKSFTQGVTYKTCVVYMVGHGGSVAQEEWTGNGGDAYSSNPIVWKAG